MLVKARRRWSFVRHGVVVDASAGGLGTGISIEADAQLEENPSFMEYMTFCVGLVEIHRLTMQNTATYTYL